ncbi:single-stranded DNA-binding protein, partial [Streptomyces sp. NPDC056534]|uniref:single-stranded DNA-binding protein n=1 Tax=Streptomyces sp. NPDC056534 TaxID=3345857 RepID=UPI0036AF09D8
MSWWESPQRFTAAGVAVARFTVASPPRTFDRATSTWRDGEATFLDCSCWRQLAENVAGSLSKGSRVVVAGRLRTDRWETPEGEKRSRMALDADDVGASMTFATVTITRTTRPAPPRETPRTQRHRRSGRGAPVLVPTPPSTPRTIPDDTAGLTAAAAAVTTAQQEAYSRGLPALLVEGEGGDGLGNEGEAGEGAAVAGGEDLPVLQVCDGPFDGGAE